MFFSESIKGKEGLKPNLPLEKGYTFSIFESADTVVQAEWNEILKNRNLFLKLEYLKILEEIDSTSFRAIYVIIYRNKIPLGIVYFQIIDFEAKTFGNLLEDQIQSLESKQTKLFEKYIYENEKEILMRLLTCGNNIVSGEHAFLFQSDISKERSFELVEKVIDKIGSREKLSGKISAILAKDFYTPVAVNSRKCFLSSEKFVQFNVEPNMIVDIPAKAATINDFISHFSKKYRNRAKQVLKIAETLEIKELSLKELEKENGSIYALYEQVYEKAKFKIVKLPQNYFVSCKKGFNEEFYLTAFYLDKKLVAFSSGFFTPDNYLEAHYIGFDYELNKEYKLYQNVLCNYIDMAIAKGKRYVNLGRTASEIKSTMGAKAHALTCYIRPQNTISKVVLKPFIQFLQPADWIPRDPFKEVEAD